MFVPVTDDRVRTLIALLASSFVAAGCATAPDRLDQSTDLRIVQESDPSTRTREWRIQTRYVVGGPTMPLGFPTYSVDVIAFEYGAGHRDAPGTSGFFLRLHARDWGWHLLRAREIDLWLDGTEHMPLGAGEYVSGGLYSNADGNFNSETIRVAIWREDLARIARARIVEVRAGGARFTLHPATLDAIAKLLAMVPDSVGLG